MDNMDGFGWAIGFVLACLALIVAGFFFHIGWVALDYVVEEYISN